VLSVIQFITVDAQNKLTLDEAINMAYENNIELNKSFASIRNAEINMDESSRLPNPTFSYSREDLKFNSLKYNEWTASGAIPINFLWDRWSNLESKEKQLESERILLDHLKTVISSEVRETYFTLYYYSDLSQKLSETLSRLSEIANSAKDRFVEGDISEYELLRIRIEVNKLKATAKEIEIQEVKYRNQLKLLIGSGESDFTLTDINQVNVKTNYTEEELIIKALENRNDLKAFQHKIESENSLLSHNKLKAIPNIYLSAGYKEQLDNFKGSVFQVNFEVPLFNRNQKAIQQSWNSIALQEKKLMFFREKVKAEVSELYTRFNINKNLYDEVSDLFLSNIFETAVYSYELGEISLVDFMDGINAFIDGSKLANEIGINFHKSFFMLEKATGIALTNFE